MIELALALQVLTWLAVTAAFAFRRGASLFHPLALYLAFHLLVFVVRPALVHFAEFDRQWTYMGFTPPPTVFAETLAVASFALICFAATSLPAGGQNSLSEPRKCHITPIQRRSFWLMIILLLPLGLLGAQLDLALFAQPAEADERLLRDADTGYTLFIGTSAYLVKAHNLLGPLAVLFLVVARFRWWAYLPVFAFLAFRFYLGSRWGVAVVGTMLLLVHLYFAGRCWPQLRHLIFVVPLLVLFHLVGQDRGLVRELFGEADGQHVVTADYAPQTWLDGLDAPDFANFDFLAYVIDRVPEYSGTYSYFSQHLALLTQPIPRVLWADKPVGSPIQLVELNAHGNFAGRTRSLPGDGWMSLGWVGVFVTMVIAGAALGGLHRLYVWHSDRLFPVLAYCAFLPVAILWFRGGMPTVVTRIGFWMLLPLVLWWALSRTLAAIDRWRTLEIPNSLPVRSRVR